MELNVILVATIVGQMILAIYGTLNKEKQMVREGEDTLPTSSYVSLVTKYIAWALVVWFSSGLIPLEWVTGGFFIPLVTIVVFLLLTYLVASTIDAIVMTLIGQVIIRRRVNEYTKKNKEQNIEQ